MSDALVSATLEEISSAESTIANNDGTIKARSQRVIAILVVAVWGITVVVILLWTILYGLGKNDFVCNAPPGSAGVQCTNGWTETTQQFKDVFAYAVVPFVTLVLGFYFGQATKSTDTP